MRKKLKADFFNDYLPFLKLPEGGAKDNLKTSPWSFAVPNRPTDEQRLAGPEQLLVTGYYRHFKQQSVIHSGVYGSLLDVLYTFGN